MSKRAAAILLSALVILTIAFFFLWRREQPKDPPMAALCQSSAGAAADRFREYAATGKESDYWYGVAEYRTFMNAYLSLQNSVSDPNYTWCSTIYGQLVLHPETAREQAAALADALELLAANCDDPNGYLRIHAVMNELIR